MQDLRARVSSEVTDAARRVINSGCKLLGVELARGKGRFFETVILAIKAVERTRVVEHSQVLVSVFSAFHISVAWIAAACACWAHKISYAIGWQRVVVIRKFSLVGPSTSKLSVPDMTYTTKAGPVVRNLTLVVA
jgi:hypothetical protein